MDSSGYISIDKLTTHDSFSSVSDFSVTYGIIVQIILLTKAIAIQGLFIDDTYL